MTFTITLGWWLIPALITLLWIIGVVYVAINDRSKSDYGFAGLYTFLTITIGSILPLFSWLIYYMIKFYSK